VEKYCSAGHATDDTMGHERTCGGIVEGGGRGEFRPRQTRQLPRVVDLKGRLLSCQNY